MVRIDTSGGSRWFLEKDYALTWCRMAGYDPRDLFEDPNPPELERVHGSVFKRKESPNA